MTVAAVARQPRASRRLPVRVALLDVTPLIAAPGRLGDAHCSRAIQQITVKFPPPPEPAALAGGSSGGGGSSGRISHGGGSIDQVKQCADNSSWHVTRRYGR